MTFSTDPRIERFYRNAEARGLTVGEYVALLLIEARAAAIDAIEESRREAEVEGHE